MESSPANESLSDQHSQFEALRAKCRFSIRLVEVEQLTASPIPGLDETWSSLEGRPIKRVPLLRLYGTTPCGQKSAVTVHNAYPYFFVNIPETVLAENDTFEKLSAYALQLAHSLNRATGLNLNQKSNDSQYVHTITVVQGKSFYGYTPDTELFFKVFMYASPESRCSCIAGANHFAFPHLPECSKRRPSLTHPACAAIIPC